MKKSGNGKRYKSLFCLISIVLLYGCGESNSAETSIRDSTEMIEKGSSVEDENRNVEDSNDFTLQTKVTEVMEDPVFENYGRLIFPTDVNISDSLELQVDVADYSLWGGSAGARMAAWLGSYGTESFGEVEYPTPGAVIMQYTGLSEVTGNEPPTYACVGTRDGIASYHTMENRIRQIQAQGTDAQIEVFEGLSHGFGLGEGTVAEGWIDEAVSFWEKNMK